MINTYWLTFAVLSNDPVAILSLGTIESILTLEYDIIDTERTQMGC